VYARYAPVVFVVHQGLLDWNDFDGSQPVLLIIDHLMQETNETVVNWFTEGSHHRNVNIIYLAQHLFPKETNSHEPSVGTTDNVIITDNVITPDSVIRLSPIV